MALGQKGACFVLKREREGQSIQIRTNEEVDYAMSGLW